MAQNVNKSKFSKKSKKPSFHRKKQRQIGKKHVREDQEIKQLLEKYETIPDSREIKTFDDFPLSNATRKGLNECNYKVPTEIQRQSIGPALKGKDILGAACTGSGKTLAFLIPVLEKLFMSKWTKLDGVGAIIISPTRELAYQIFETLKRIGAHHDFSSGLIIGGKNLKFEKVRMDQCNIIICTPGRLLQHMDENPLFNCTPMQILVLDEADRCLDLGFSQTMNAIIENLPPQRQTLLFSATQTKSVKDLARLSLKSPTYIAPHEKSEATTPVSLRQNYVVVSQEDKINMLWSFIKSHLKQKTIVFMSSCKQVKYTFEIFSKLRPGISLLALYGTLHQERRMSIYDEFCKRNKVVLFATDIASRGLDFPTVNWVIQLDCPEDVNAYIHRAGRTARHKANGESLLVLTPHEEEPMIEILRENKIPIEKISIDPQRMFSPQVKIEAYIAQSSELKESAQRAFVAYIKSVHLMKNKKVFNVESINFDEYARSLGLAVTPRVRFLQRLKKRKEEKCLDENPKKEKLKSIDLNALMANDSSDDDDAGLMKIKRKDHDIEESESEEILEKPKERNEKKKVVTKAAIAKKLMKKKIIPNKKFKFDEDGKEVINTAKQLQSELAKEYEDADEGGIDIEKAKELLRAEDKFDKQRFRELVKMRHREMKKKLKKKKEKEESESGSDFESDEGPDISWLPNYNKNSKNSEDDEEEGPIHKPPAKLYEKKRANSESIEEEPVLKKSKKRILIKLDLNDTEALAMSLLNN